MLLMFKDYFLYHFWTRLSKSVVTHWKQSRCTLRKELHSTIAGRDNSSNRGINKKKITCEIKQAQTHSESTLSIQCLKNLTDFQINHQMQK